MFPDTDQDYRNQTELTLNCILAIKRFSEMHGQLAED